MGYVLEFKKALNAKEVGEQYVVANIPVICPHCKGTRFYESNALLDDRAGSTLGIEAFGNCATTLTCTYCGQVMWYANSSVIEQI